MFTSIKRYHQSFKAVPVRALFKSPEGVRGPATRSYRPECARTVGHIVSEPQCARCARMCPEFGHVPEAHVPKNVPFLKRHIRAGTRHIERFGHTGRGIHR